MALGTGAGVAKSLGSSLAGAVGACRALGRRGMDSSNEPFSLTVDDDGQHVVVWIRGELDIATGPQLQQCLADFAKRSITLDFAGVTFMDSSGVAALATARKQRGTVVLRSVGPVQRRVLEATGLADQFHFDDE